MSTTKTIHYGTLYLNVRDHSKKDKFSLASSAIQKLRDLYFSVDHKIPNDSLDFGFQLIRTSDTFSHLATRLLEKDHHPSEIKETVAFFTCSITMKSSVSSFVPDNDLIRSSRFDPYKPVAWIREFAHDPWENPLLCVDWVVTKIKLYCEGISTKDVAHLCPREIVWKVPESYLGLQKALLFKGFIVEQFHREYLTFSRILT